MKFLVADDHPLVRRALSLSLSQIRPDATILEAASVTQALEQLAAHPDIDLVLLDLGMPDVEGLDGLAAVRRTCRDVPVAVVSADETPDTALRALGAGAMGYLPKSLPEDVLRAALGLILAGGTYVPPLVTEGPSGRHGAPPAGAGGSGFGANASGANAFAVGRTTAVEPLTMRANSGPRGRAALTPRQSMVLDLVIEGLSNREIAAKLNLAEATIKVHMTAILRAFGVNNRAKAISAAQRDRQGAV